jgi:predicted Zn-dependent protease
MSGTQRVELWAEQADELAQLASATSHTVTYLVNHAVKRMIEQRAKAATMAEYRITQVYTAADEPIDATIQRLTAHLAVYRKVRIIRADGIVCDLTYQAGYPAAASNEGGDDATG